MPRYSFEVADIFRHYGAPYRQVHGASLSPGQHRTMRAIEICRTAELGGHVEQCDSCGHNAISYNSCRNRHCPKCQSIKKAEWLEERRKEILPVEYFHVVFTVPESIAAIGLQNKRVIYDILFRATSETLRKIAADPKHLGADIGFLAILHTWGQNLLHHPHIHCVVPGGGLTPDGQQWISPRKGFFLPVRVLSRLFRGLFLDYLRQAFEGNRLQFFGDCAYLDDSQAFSRFLQASRKNDWVVYAKPPFGGPAQVLDYLGRYTHRVAISNNRLLSIEHGSVTFRWKDYRRGNTTTTMTLDADEFIRRFLLHVLPQGYVRIRHFGFLANRHREAKLLQCRQVLHAVDYAHEHGEVPHQDWKARYEALTGQSLTACPSCHKGRMVCIEVLYPLRYMRSSLPVGVDSS
jgi:hypothetical protein